MCVIISRNPGIVIEEQKIESACQVNPHGFGISVLDRGKIETIREYKESGNCSKRVLKILEDAKDQQVYVHLRFSTKGAKNVDNCHPFTLFRGDDNEYMFMHNGTMYSYGNDDVSDSREFAEKFLKPLTEAFYAKAGDALFTEPVYKEIVEKYRNSTSVFTLYDAKGNNLMLGSGVQHEGWWSSNEYSFNRYHREAEKDSRDYSPWEGGSSYGSGGHNTYNYLANQQRSANQDQDKRMRATPFHKVNEYYAPDKKQWGRWEASKFVVNEKLCELDYRCKDYDSVKAAEYWSSRRKEESTPAGKSLTVIEGGGGRKETKESSSNETTGKGANVSQAIKDLMNDCGAIGQAINKAKKANLDPCILTAPEKRTTFVEFAELDSLEDVTMLDEDGLYELVDQLPLAATMLLMDLIYELFTKKQFERIHEAARKNGEQKQEEQKVVNQ